MRGVLGLSQNWEGFREVVGGYVVDGATEVVENSLESNEVGLCEVYM
jgi:hypothetical protein